MTFLPIVERELRVAARSRFTFWSRLAAAAFALAIFAALQFLAQKSGGAVAAGQLEFTILKWLAFIYACAMGLFLTADSLSEEKREGTLGLLFLTDLRGYDVVFGKLLTQSLRAFYGLLAAFPIMGLALLAGGVTGGEFTRSILVICNTLLFSLSLGMLVSAVSRDSTKAMNATLLLLLLILGGLPFVDFALGGFDGANFHAIFTLASPGYLFSRTGGYRFNEYWICLILQNALAWVFLALASLRTPHSWQDVSTTTSSSRPDFFGRWRFGGPRARLALRQRLLSPNPILWLTLRDRWLPRFIWTLTLIVLLLRVWGLAVSFGEVRVPTIAVPNAYSAVTNSSLSGTAPVSPSTNSTFRTVTARRTVTVGTPATRVGSPAFQVFLQLTSTLGWLLKLALFLWLASQASRFFVDAVRNGALELILVTPVWPDQVIRGQWAALLRTFMFPIISLVFLKLTGVVLSIVQMTHQMPYSFTTFGVTVTSSGFSDPEMIVYMIVTALTGVLTFLADLAAVAWFGMWLGLTNRRTSLAVLKSILFVLVLPWIAFIFAQIFFTLAIRLSGNSILARLLPAIFVVGLTLAKDTFFIGWSWRNLRVNFREQITGDRGHRHRPAVPPPLPPQAPPSYLPPAIPPAANAI
jgi:hypothetical protein